jgi:hypothetical protein
VTHSLRALRPLRFAVAALLLHLGTALATPAPAEVTATIAGARLVGSGVLRYFGFEVYEARLWADAAFVSPRYAEQPFALELRYARALEGRAIALRSIEEMRRAGPLAEAEQRSWMAALQAAFPDVRAGDRLTGTHDPRGVTRFFHNGRPTATITDPAFAPRFFGIWLASTTSAPELRERLLGSGR